MGFAIQSAVTTQTLNSFTDIVNTSVQNVITENSQTCTADNRLRINIGQPFVQDGILVPCAANFDGNVTVNQVAKQSCTLDSNTLNNLSANLSTELNKNIKQWIQTGLDSKQGFFPAAFSAQVAVNQNSQTIADRITNGLTANVTTTCKTFIGASNDAIFNICGNFKKDFNFNQNITQQNLTSCISQNTIDFISKDTILEDMSQTADTKLASDQEGVFGGLKWLIIGGIILGVIIVIGIVLFLLFGGRKSAVVPQVISAMNPRLQEEIEECLGPVRRKLHEEGIPLTRENERPLVERCLLQRKEKRERLNSDTRLAEATQNERQENISKFGTPTRSTEILSNV